MTTSPTSSERPPSCQADRTLPSPATVIALIAACSRALGYLEALTEAETVKADEIVEQLQAALELAGKVEGGEAK